MRPMRLSAFVLHAAAAGIMAWGWFGILRREALRAVMTSRKGGSLLFLTNQGLAISWACMFLSLFCDVFPSVTVVRHLKRALLLISLPLEFVISSIYWTLLAFLPHLILLPKIGPDGVTPHAMRLPLSIDLALHATPMITLLIDFFAFEPRFSKKYVQRVAPLVVIGFAIWYASFVEYCSTFNGSFPYPFLTFSPFPVRVLIYIATGGIALGCFRTLNALHV